MKRYVILWPSISLKSNDRDTTLFLVGLFLDLFDTKGRPKYFNGSIGMKIKSWQKQFDTKRTCCQSICIYGVSACFNWWLGICDADEMTVHIRTYIKSHSRSTYDCGRFNHSLVTVWMATIPTGMFSCDSTTTSVIGVRATLYVCLGELFESRVRARVRW